MQARLALLPAGLLFAASLLPIVQAANFTFTFGSPTQCDNFPISWSGGTPPFQLVLVPAFGTPRTFDIPSLNFNNGKGSFEAQIPFNKDTNMLAYMSDASGLTTGGISDVLTVGAPSGLSSCNTTDPGVDFTFELNTALQQCRPYTFSSYDGAIQPVTILGLVPGGDSIILNPPAGRASFDWTADARAGTSILFVMSDSKGRKGGSSDVKIVGVTDDASCISPNSPMSVSNTPSPTASTTSSSSQSTSSSMSSELPANDASTKKSNTGVIVGGTLAGIFGLATLVALALFLLRRKRQSGSYYDGTGFYGSRRTNSVDLDPPTSVQDGQAPVIHPFPYTASESLATTPGFARHSASPSSHNLLGAESQYDTRTQFSHLTNPYSVPPSVPSEYSQRTRRPSGSDILGGQMSAEGSSAIGGLATSSMSSSARREKSGMPAYKPTRYIVHADLEEVAPPDEEEEVVELPPQYSERRAPIRGLSGSLASPAHPAASQTVSSPLDHEQGEMSPRLQRPIQPLYPSPVAGQFAHNGP